MSSAAKDAQLVLPPEGSVEPVVTNELGRAGDILAHMGRQT
ncbi:MAG: hypothetical protein QM619_09870 [Micropruina sp.]